ncbi:hypothetical protein HRG84_05810 [Flavisolibacter sp. BT320]|nr:hypothetical protein [Flavisolibacter longurius]
MTKLLLLLLFLSHMSFGQSKSEKRNLSIDTSVNLYAFVGEKISVVRYDPNSDSNTPTSIEIDEATGDTITMRKRSFVMDNAFEARYKVLHAVYNDLRADTIVFMAFDHYGRPAFENHSTVLLYLSKSKDGSHYFHQKYQFDPLAKSKEGSWKGKNGESLEKLFNAKKKTVFRERGVFQR